MVTTTMSRESGTSENRLEDDAAHRLVVTWQHPISRDVSPIGILTYDGHEYAFVYLAAALEVEGFGPLLGFPDMRIRYVSDELFQLFAQRAMDARRPDFEHYVTELGLDTGATPWEQISRSTGARGSDTLQLFPVPHREDDAWVCDFLVHGVRHLLEKDVVFAGKAREKPEAGVLESRIMGLEVGSELRVEHESTNAYSQTALLVASESGLPIGWVPNWLSTEVLELQLAGMLSFRVEKVNPADAGWHLRIVAKMRAACEKGYAFFSGERWTTLA